MPRPDLEEYLAKLVEEGRNPKEEIHLPAPSYFPFIVGIGMLFLAYGITYVNDGIGIPLLALGGLTVLGAFVGWSVEPLEEPHDEHGEPEDEEVTA